MKKIFLLLLMPLFVVAQTPTLLKDINTIGDKVPETFAILNGIVYFAHSDDIHGVELWRSDGTTTGTYMVKDLNFGPEDGLSTLDQPIVFNNKLVFIATDQYSGREIYKSDGTATGTQLAIDLNPGNTSSEPSLLTNCGDHRLVFVAKNNIYGKEVWQCDTTLTYSSTTILNDFTPGSGSSAINQLIFAPTFLAGTLFINILQSASPNAGIWKTSFSCFFGCGAFGTPTKINGTEVSRDLLFLANTNTQQFDLFFRDFAPGNLKKYNLNSNTTLQLTNINSAQYFYDLYSTNNTIIFQFIDATNGVELWKSDGTVAGTGLLKDINVGSTGTGIREMTKINNELYFSASTPNGRNLWKTDGTIAGTEEVLDIDPGSTIQDFYGMRNVGSQIYFFTFGQYNPENSANIQLRVFDTSNSNYTSVKSMDLLPDLESDFIAMPLNNNLIFTAYDHQNGFAIWKTNGTNTGTQLVKDVSQGTSAANSFTLTQSTNTVYFLSKEHSYFEQKLFKINPNNQVSKVSDNFIHSYAALDANTLILSAKDANYGRELWKTDGTPSGTTLVKDIETVFDSSEPSNFTKLNTKIVFTASVANTYGNELWITDGTNAGTNIIKDIIAGGASSQPQFLTELNGFVYFSANSNNQGYELWKTDGTLAGTNLVKDIVPGSQSSSPKHLTKLGNKLFFIANEINSGEELWVSDGTAAGTQMVKDIRQGPLSPDIKDFTALGNFLYFSADNGIIGRELWRTDGTIANTIPFNINEEHSILGSILIENSNPQNLTAIGNKLYFSAEKAIYQNPFIYFGRELWSYTIGDIFPVLVKDANPFSGNKDGISFKFNGNFRSLGNIIYYPGTDGPHGFELWRSDGTSAGTFMVQDLYKGLANGINYVSNNEMFGNPYSGMLYFNATDSQNGYELWNLSQCSFSQNIILTLPTSIQKKQSSQFITSSSNISNTNITYGNLDINYRAGKSVTLQPGFSVEGIKLPQNRKSVFTAEIGGCL